MFTKRDPVHETKEEGHKPKEEGHKPKDIVTDSDDERKMGGWRFFLWWMLAFLGFPIGGLLAFVLVGSVDGAVSGALGGALAGAVIGAAQWLVLRRYMRVGPEWILATALGVASALSRTRVAMVVVVVVLGVLGAVVAIAVISCSPPGRRG